MVHGRVVSLLFHHFLGREGSHTDSPLDIPIMATTQDNSCPKREEEGSGVRGGQTGRERGRVQAM